MPPTRSAVASCGVAGGEAANDRLTLGGGLGNDAIDALGVAAGAMLLTLNGGGQLGDQVFQD